MIVQLKELRKNEPSHVKRKGNGEINKKIGKARARACV